MKTFIGYLITAACIFIFAASGQARDVTERVIERTDVEEQIRAFCAQYCQGNKSQGKLTRMTIEHVKKHYFKILADVTLLNRHVLGNGVELFSYPIQAQGIGILNGKTCSVRIENITVANDPTGVFNRLAAEEKGNIYKIQDCAILISGPSN